MGDVVHLHAAKSGEQAFMACNCKPDDPVPYIVVAITGPRPIITGLLCPECETQHDVVMGIVQTK